MRTRLALTGATVAAALLIGGTAATAAQAVPASARTSTASPVVAGTLSYIDAGTYRTKSACEADGRASVYSDWYCKPSTTTTNWHLMVNPNS
ncbi:hypothetical protein [Kitasatospora sp. NPDC001547]|uniref:hypothetical protein n=1 Tax=Kitasatospora sp. NPDC001547 TaxID=3364015 RepID=UPI0036C1C63B|nr:hypothetical protein KitaXyl93_68230 [Kitasatospora sp. Xyl93]